MKLRNQQSSQRRLENCKTAEFALGPASDGDIEDYLREEEKITPTNRIEESIETDTTSL